MSESQSIIPNRSTLAAFLPVALLLLLVPLFMSTTDYRNFGLLLIIGSFVSGVVSFLCSPIPYLYRENSDWSTALVFLGGSLVAGAVLLFLVFGCVFGCPG